MSRVSFQRDNSDKVSKQDKTYVWQGLVCRPLSTRSLVGRPLSQGTWSRCAALNLPRPPHNHHVSQPLQSTPRQPLSGQLIYCIIRLHRHSLCATLIAVNPAAFHRRGCRDARTVAPMSCLPRARGATLGPRPCLHRITASPHHRMTACPRPFPSDR